MNKVFTPEIIKLLYEFELSIKSYMTWTDEFSESEKEIIRCELSKKKDLIITLIKENCDAN